MTKETIIDTVRQFLSEEFEIDANKITMDAKMKEEKFGFIIKVEEMAGIVTINDFCTFIEQKTSK